MPSRPSDAKTSAALQLVPGAGRPGYPPPADPQPTPGDIEAHYGMLFRHSLDGVILSCPDGTILEANPSACRILGRTEEEIIRAGREDLIDTSDPRLKILMVQRKRTGRARGELRLKRKDGTLIPVEVSAVQFKDAQGMLRICIIFRDITTRKRAEEALAQSQEKLRKALDRERQLARSDALTGVYNSRAFYEIAESELHRAKRYGHPLSLAFFDLDNFKKVNDRLGHITGDDALVHVAAILKHHARKSDVVARLGGDEFVVLMPSTAAEGAGAAVSKLQEMLLQEMRRAGWPVSFSIGLVTGCASALSIKEVLNAADSLMYQAKRSGKNKIVQGPQPQNATIQKYMGPFVGKWLADQADKISH